MPDRIKTNRQAEPEDVPFLERVMRYLDATLDPDGTAKLKEELAADPAKREAFAMICLSDTIAHEELPAINAADAGELELDEKTESEAANALHEAMIMPAINVAPDESPTSTLPLAAFGKTRNTSKWQWRKSSGWAALLLLGTALWFARHAFQSKPIPPMQNDNTPTAIASAPTVATLSGVAGAHWENASENPGIGDALIAGQILELKSGCASVRFKNDAEVILEAPGRLKLTSSGAVELERGRVAVKMTSGKSGFVVTTPDTTVTDLGTEFGVSVDKLAKATDVHVFVGRVLVASPAAAILPRNVTAGALAHVSAGQIAVTTGASVPQLFVRDISNTPRSLDVVDLISGGDGVTYRRGGVIDPITGASSVTAPLSPWYSGKNAMDRPLSDGRYHAVSALPVVDGCFVPDKTGQPAQVDSSGRTYTFPITSGVSSMRICVGGNVPAAPNGDAVDTTLGGIDYSAANHGFILLHSNGGMTFDLGGLRRLHPNNKLARFHCTFGNSNPSPDAKSHKADFFVLLDGNERLSKKQFTSSDGAMIVDVPLADSDRFLTIAATDGGDNIWFDEILLGDPSFDLK